MLFKKTPSRAFFLAYFSKKHLFFRIFYCKIFSASKANFHSEKHPQKVFLKTLACFWNYAKISSNSLQKNKVNYEQYSKNAEKLPYSKFNNFCSFSNDGVALFKLLKKSISNYCASWYILDFFDVISVSFILITSQS